MTIEALIKPEVNSAETWDSLLAVHGLWQHTRKLQGEQRSGMADLLARLRTQPYTAPDGECIVVVPHGRSREIPLHVEVFDDDDDDWHRISSDSETYETLVGFERLYDPYFVGRSVEQDTVDGKIYVYDDSHDVRVLASDDARFYQTADTRSSEVSL